MAPSFFRGRGGPSEAGAPETPEALVLILTEMLGLGLPRPDSLYMNLHFHSHRTTGSAQLHFNRVGKLAALQAWADRFGATITQGHATDDPGHTWNKIEFTNSGVRFTCIAPLWWTAPD